MELESLWRKQKSWVPSALVQISTKERCGPIPSRWWHQWNSVTTHPIASQSGKPQPTGSRSSLLTIFALCDHRHKSVWNIYQLCSEGLPWLPSLSEDPTLHSLTVSLSFFFNTHSSLNISQLWLNAYFPTDLFKACLPPREGQVQEGRLLL